MEDQFFTPRTPVIYRTPVIDRVDFVIVYETFLRDWELLASKILKNAQKFLAERFVVYS